VAGGELLGERATIHHGGISVLPKSRLSHRGGGIPLSPRGSSRKRQSIHARRRGTFSAFSRGKKNLKIGLQCPSIFCRKIELIGAGRLLFCSFSRAPLFGGLMKSVTGDAPGREIEGESSRRFNMSGLLPCLVISQRKEIIGTLGAGAPSKKGRGKKNSLIEGPIAVIYKSPLAIVSCQDKDLRGKQVPAIIGAIL